MEIFGKSEVARQKEADDRSYNMNMDLQSAGNLQKAGAAEDQILLDLSRDRSDLIKWQQSLSDEVTQLKHDLRGEIIEDGRWVKKRGVVRYEDYDGTRLPVDGDIPALMNDVGIQMVETTVRPLTSRNLMNSNLSEDMIRDILKNTEKTVVANMVNNHGLYDVEFANYDHIIRMVKNVIRPAPFRALNNGERKYAGMITKRIEAHSETPGMYQQKKKLFGGIV